MAAYPPETYDARDDLKAHYLYEEHMHQLEAEQAEKERIIDEALMAYEAEGFDEEAEVPA